MASWGVAQTKSAIIRHLPPHLWHVNIWNQNYRKDRGLRLGFGLGCWRKRTAAVARVRNFFLRILRENVIPRTKSLTIDPVECPAIPDLIEILVRIFYSTMKNFFLNIQRFRFDKKKFFFIQRFGWDPVCIPGLGWTCINWIDAVF